MGKKITFKNSQDFEDNYRMQTETGPDGNASSQSEISLLEMTGRLLRYKKIIFAVMLLAIVITTIKVLFTPNTYRSYATLLPTGKVDKFAQLKQLAGWGGTVTGDENSSELFPVILQSQLIRDALLDKTYRFEHHGRQLSTTLSDYFGESNRDNLRLCLKNTTTIDKNRNGVIELSATTIYPGLSQALVSEYVKQLEDYNRYKRRSQATENETYMARQIEITRTELAQSEDALEEFQLANSDWAFTTDPTILKELSRLKREVEAKSRALLYLMQEHEIAKQDINKDTPVVRILDEPTLPVLKTGPHRKIMVSLAAAVAFLGTVFVILLLELLNKRKQGPDRASYEYLRRSFAEAFPRTDQTVNRLAKITREKIGV